MKKIEKIVSTRGYVVTEDGRLLNPKGVEIGVINNSGYRASMVRVMGKKVWFSHHRLQAYQKYGDKLYNPGIVVRHVNGNQLDASWENILIGTGSDNMMDIPENIRIKRAAYASSFIKKHNHQEIRSYHEKCKSYKATMDKFGITSKGTLHYILNV